MNTTSETTAPATKKFPRVNASGYYLGPVLLAADQLNPGEWVFVDGAVNVDFPRELQPHECARLVDGEWVYQPCWRSVDLFDKDTGARVHADYGDTPEALNATTIPFPGDGFTWIGLDWAETPDAIKARLKACVQRLLDETAQAQGYDDIKSAVTYADEPAVPRFQAEGQAFRAWRSQVWDTCYQLLDQALNGEIAVPTEAELLGQLTELAPLNRPSSN